mmetsp:Transcript_76619/g.185427  ORF Transcript_76619/g.185427 Transcript_76619/m.185427 type:complete len:342 (+) Transcript_76619:287-1312(+)
MRLRVEAAHNAALHQHHHGQDRSQCVRNAHVDGVAPSLHAGSNQDGHEGQSGGNPHRQQARRLGVAAEARGPGAVARPDAAQAAQQVPGPSRALRRSRNPEERQRPRDSVQLHHKQELHDRDEGLPLLLDTSTLPVHVAHDVLRQEVRQANGPRAQCVQQRPDDLAIAPSCIERGQEPSGRDGGHAKPLRGGVPVAKKEHREQNHNDQAAAVQDQLQQARDGGICQQQQSVVHAPRQPSAEALTMEHSKHLLASVGVKRNKRVPTPVLDNEEHVEEYSSIDAQREGEGVAVVAEDTPKDDHQHRHDSICQKNAQASQRVDAVERMLTPHRTRACLPQFHAS